MKSVAQGIWVFLLILAVTYYLRILTAGKNDKGSYILSILGSQIIIPCEKHITSIIKQTFERLIYLHINHKCVVPVQFIRDVEKEKIRSSMLVVARQLPLIKLIAAFPAVPAIMLVFMGNTTFSTAAGVSGIMFIALNLYHFSMSLRLFLYTNEHDE